MPRKAARKRKNQCLNSSSNSLTPRLNIKTEVLDDWEQVAVNGTSTSKQTTNKQRPLQPIRIKTEKPSGGNATVAFVNIKKEKPDDDNDSVTFVHTPLTTIQINDSPNKQPKKKRKFDNGQSRSQNPVVVKREVLSPARNRGSNHRASNYSNHTPNFWQSFEKSQFATGSSDSILRNIKLSANGIRALQQQHRKKITDLFGFLKIQSQIECNGNYVNRLIVAKIKIANSANFRLDNLYRAMRRDMVGWIERCQIMGRKTPCYHNAFIDQPFVIVLCADSYAYDCLCEYINFTYRFVSIEYLQRHIGNTLYCYAVTADDLVYDTGRFMQQINLHLISKGDLVFANKWILVRHEVNAAAEFTSFVFFVDYTSSLTLEYVHKNSLFISMLVVKFAYCGKVPCNF